MVALVCEVHDHVEDIIHIVDWKRFAVVDALGHGREHVEEVLDDLVLFPQDFGGFGHEEPIRVHIQEDSPNPFGGRKLKGTALIEGS